MLATRHDTNVCVWFFFTSHIARSALLAVFAHSITAVAVAAAEA